MYILDLVLHNSSKGGFVNDLMPDTMNWCYETYLLRFFSYL